MQLFHDSRRVLDVPEHWGSWDGTGAGGRVRKTPGLGGNNRDRIPRQIRFPEALLPDGGSSCLGNFSVKPQVSHEVVSWQSLLDADIIAGMRVA